MVHSHMAHDKNYIVWRYDSALIQQGRKIGLSELWYRTASAGGGTGRGGPHQVQADEADNKIWHRSWKLQSSAYSPDVNNPKLWDSYERLSLHIFTLLLLYMRKIIISEFN